VVVGVCSELQYDELKCEHPGTLHA